MSDEASEARVGLRIETSNPVEAVVAIARHHRGEGCGGWLFGVAIGVMVTDGLTAEEIEGLARSFARDPKVEMLRRVTALVEDARRSASGGG